MANTTNINYFCIKIQLYEHQFRILRDGVDIFKHYTKSYFICIHLYYSIKQLMLSLRKQCHPGGSKTSGSVNKEHQRITQASRL